jgi:hypothetical protein
MLVNISTRASTPTNKDRLNIAELPETTVRLRPSLRRSGAAEQALEGNIIEVAKGTTVAPPMDRMKSA